MLTRRWFLATVSALVAAIPAPRFLRSAAAGAPRRSKLTFLLMNDVYEMEEKVFPDGVARGGFARLAAAIRTERARGGRVLLAHAGDTLSPSLMSEVDQGRHIIDLTNTLAPDIFVPGNHEFDFGKDVFLERMNEAAFPRLAANLRTREGAPAPGFRDNLVLELDGVRVGVVGIAYEASHQLSSPGDLVFNESVETAEREAIALRRQGVDVVVVVMHADRADSIRLQRTGVADVLLTGHTHDLYVSYDGRVCLVESGYDGHFLTAVDLDIAVLEAKGRRTVSWRPNFRVIDTASVDPDPDVRARVASLSNRLKRELGAPLAATKTELDTRAATVRRSEAAMGNLIADAIRAFFKADAAIINGGDIRGDAIYPPGHVMTRADILKEMPFGNRLALLELSGRNLLLALEHGLSSLPQPDGRFPQVSGLRVRYRPWSPPGMRVETVDVAGAPLEEGRFYRVATLDFLARGGDGYTTLASAKGRSPEHDGPLLTTIVIDYIQALKTIDSEVEGRVMAAPQP